MMTVAPAPDQSPGDHPGQHEGMATSSARLEFFTAARTPGRTPGSSFQARCCRFCHVVRPDVEKNVRIRIRSRQDRTERPCLDAGSVGTGSRRSVESRCASTCLPKQTTTGASTSTGFYLRQLERFATSFHDVSVVRHPDPRVQVSTQVGTHHCDRIATRGRAPSTRGTRWASPTHVHPPPGRPRGRSRPGGMGEEHRRRCDR